MKLYYQSIVFIMVVGVLSYSECMYSRNDIGPIAEFYAREEQVYDPHLFTTEQSNSASVPIPQLATSRVVAYDQDEQEEMHHSESKEDDHTQALQIASSMYELLEDAVIRDYVDIVQDYLNQGVNVNTQQDTTGKSLLHLAVMSHAHNVAQLLLDRSADINIVDVQGDTPLHDAAQINELFMVQLLLAKGADTQIKNKEGKLAVDYATDVCKQLFIQQKSFADSQELTL